jgi:hypothetical protein
MGQCYSDPSRESDPYALPDVEVFYVEQSDREEFLDSEGEPLEEGWYYWFCFPGCLPDSEAFGPYATEQEAIDAARDE